MSMQRVRGIPLSALSPKFLHTNSTSHTWPFSAIAELIDNAYDPDVMARQFWIDWTRIKGFDCLTFQDNGNGLTRSRMYKMLSFGFSEKQIVKGHIPVGVYGNGFKSGSMRLGKDAIVFSKTRDSMSVGLLSQTYLKSIQAKHVVVPIITFRRVGQNLDEDAASLQAILKHSLFNTVEELFSELRAISCISSTGTRVIIWNLRRVTNGETEFDFSTDRYDIQILANACEKYKHQDHVAQLVPEIDYSLRAYCSILYLKPRMQIIIRGQKVKTQLISQSLAHRATDYYRPSFLNKRVRVIFGYNTNSKEQYGIMMYHKNRLIKAYVRVGCQRKGDFRGVGVIGVIECNFLQPTHNKQDFDNTDEYRKTVNNLGVKLEEYWNEIRFRCKNENPRCTIPIEDTIKCPDQTWVQCDECLKWRKIPDGIDCKRLPDKWFCHMNPDPQYRSCRTEEEPEDSEDEQHSYPKPYKRRKKNSKMKGEENKQQSPSPSPLNTQVPAPALLLTAMPLSESEAWRPLEGAVIWPSCTGQGHSLANDTMLMDNESHQSTTVERVKQMSPHAVGVSLMEMDNPAMATPSLPPLIPASTQMNIKPAPSTECWGKEVENQGEPSLEEACENEMAAKALERNGPRKVMMLLKHQQEVVWEPMQTSTQERDAYREQVHQLQKELEEVKHRCEYLQVVEREHDNLQRRLEDMEVKNTELTCQCEQLKKELKQLRRKKHTGTPSTEEGTQNNVNISSPEEDGRKLRNLRQCVGRLLVTFVPALDLDQVNLNSEVIDEILEQVLNEVT